MLLLAGLVGAFHLGRRVPSDRRGGRRVMAAVPMEHGLVLAAVLFGLGLTGVLVRRNIIFVLLSLEIMLNAAALAFVVAGAHWGQPDGQVMFFFILAMAAAEVAVGTGAGGADLPPLQHPGRRYPEPHERMTCSTCCG